MAPEYAAWFSLDRLIGIGKVPSKGNCQPYDNSASCTLSFLHHHLLLPGQTLFSVSDTLRETKSTERRVGSSCFSISRTLPATLHISFPTPMHMTNLLSSRSWMRRRFWGLGGFLPVSDSNRWLRSVPCRQTLPESLALAKLLLRSRWASVGLSWLFLTCRISPSLQALFFAEC